MAFPRLHRLDKDGFQHHDGTRPRSHLDLPRSQVLPVHEQGLWLCESKKNNINIGFVSTTKLYTVYDILNTAEAEHGRCCLKSYESQWSSISDFLWVIPYLPSRNEDYFYRTFPTTKQLSKTCFSICFSAHPYHFLAKHWHPVGAFGEVSAWCPTKNGSLGYDLKPNMHYVVMVRYLW